MRIVTRSPGRPRQSLVLRQEAGLISMVLGARDRLPFCPERVCVLMMGRVEGD